MLPNDIEASSFSIIEEEAGSHGFDPPAWDVVRRVIHTSADFEYLRSMRIHGKAINAGIAAIRAGCPIVTDTNMVRAGLRKNELAAFGCEVRCLMEDPGVAETARKRGTTRAAAAMDAAAGWMKGGICVVGNAPTALLRLLALVGENRAAPALVIALPVGFVNAAESKAALARTDTPHITNTGRKGGSNVAAAVVNSLVLQANKTGE